MKTILVSGASGIVGYGILKSLRKSHQSLRLIGTSIYPESIANYFCDIFEQSPLTADPFYIDWLVKTIKKHNVDLIISGIDADMYKWNDNYNNIKSQCWSEIAQNNDKLIDLCNDKWLFYQELLKFQSNYEIETVIKGDFTSLQQKFGLPFLLKPRKGFGSKNIIIVNNWKTFIEHWPLENYGYMAQPVIGNVDEEYTVGLFGDATGSYSAAIILKRYLSNNGYTERAEVVNDPDIMDACGKICSFFRPTAATNLQFRKQDGKVKLLEINPRISSSASIRTAFGYNESEMMIDFFLNHKLPEQPVLKKGKAIRYIEDHIIYS